MRVPDEGEGGPGKAGHEEPREDEERDGERNDPNRAGSTPRPAGGKLSMALVTSMARVHCARTR